VNKDKFQSAVLNYTSLEKDEAIELISLANNFPYSQLIHNLASRGAQDLDFLEKEKCLHQSAIYSTDRAVLKLIMTVPKQPRLVVIETHENTDQPNATVAPAHSNQPTEIQPSNLNGEALYIEVAEDLKRLSESKGKFEKVMAELEQESAKPLSKISQAKPLAESQLGSEENKNPAQKTKPEAPKQKEQTEIIDAFIKTQPSITPAKPVVLKSEDLSDKYDVYGENIVSETLVEILLKQGKKEKAIEMLKKLIWKFPQKKAYFAAQIEELKK
jgi:tetratricopeptide (TPR) repeat protein